MKLGKISVLVLLLSAVPCGKSAAQSVFSDRAADSVRVSLPDSLRSAAPRDTIVISVPSAPARIAVPVLEEARRLTDTEKLALADSLHDAYQFRRAAQLSEEIATESADSLVRLYATELLESSESGLAMSSNVSLPKVIARQKFTLGDFFLYYPFPDGSWHSTSDCKGLRDSLQTARTPELLGILPDITYFQEDDEAIYFSAPDTLGNMRIYSSARDTLWSRPRQVFPIRDTSCAVTDSTVAGTVPADSASWKCGRDEIFPVLSADRRSLYFSARGKGSAGGYDLYESVWNEASGCWSEPVNLGFPYSSVDNDYLYMNTDDGRYTVFASDRGCTRDSVFVYVLEYEFSPKQQSVTDADRLRQIVSLVPDGAPDNVDAGSAVDRGIPESADTKRYMEKMEEVRRLRGSLDSENQKLDRMREEFAMSDDVERRQELTSSILETESVIPRIQAELDSVVSEVQKIEMEFLFSGVVIDYGSMSSEASRNIVGDGAGYLFKERRMGAPLRVETR